MTCNYQAGTPQDLYTTRNYHSIEDYLYGMLDLFTVVGLKQVVDLSSHWL